MTTAAGGLLGSGLPAMAGRQTRAKSVIHLFMSGGMSHLDTFDPKPGLPGSVPSIPTNVPGIFISSNLPRLADRMDRITLFRSMSHAAKSHQAARMATLDFPAEWSFAAPSQDGTNDFMRDIVAARRRIENRARLVCLELEGWDTHTDNAGRTAIQSSILDTALADLLDELSFRNLLSETLVVLSTEFGRSARLNGFGGRNHHPHAYTCLMAGGGTEGGRVIGATTDDGMEAIGNTTSPEQFNAIIASRLGSDSLA